MVSLENSENLTIIDYEEVGWQPRAFDFAVYFNETMIDNAYPLKNGIKCYLNNFINKEEQ